MRSKSHPLPLLSNFAFVSALQPYPCSLSSLYYSDCYFLCCYVYLRQVSSTLNPLLIAAMGKRALEDVIATARANIYNFGVRSMQEVAQSQKIYNYTSKTMRDQDGYLSLYEMYVCLLIKISVYLY